MSTWQRRHYSARRQVLWLIIAARHILWYLGCPGVLLACTDHGPAPNTDVKLRLSVFPREKLVSQEGALMRKQVRLAEPLVRDNGRLRPASWDEALDRAAAGFAAARERDATKSFGMFSCSKATNEMNYAAQKFTRAVMGSNNIDSCNRT